MLRSLLQNAVDSDLSRCAIGFPLLELAVLDELRAVTDGDQFDTTNEAGENRQALDDES
jgi:hypothetical protein